MSRLKKEWPRRIRFFRLPTFSASNLFTSVAFIILFGYFLDTEIILHRDKLNNVELGIVMISSCLLMSLSGLASLKEKSIVNSLRLRITPGKPAIVSGLITAIVGSIGLNCLFGLSN